ncbi:MAG: rhodanese-like domain-containing protein [Acetobacteraceae bacterium]|nr:rhodanese-like domain-containing protein [Acetobacteraceae bacterium]
MPVTAKELLAAANAAVPRIPGKEAMDLAKSGNVLFVDVRDGTELAASGKVPGALHTPRGVLEFRACPESAMYDKAFDRSKTLILYCGSGGRAALAGKTLKDLGYADVRNLGGFKDWLEAGGTVEKI